MKEAGALALEGKRLWFTSAVLCILAAALMSCGGKAPRAPGPTAPPVKRALDRMGFSIQVGAFSDVRNAMRLVDGLERSGVGAYYFRHASGPFKVCFGNFPTVEEARSKADALVRAGVVSGYQVVRPEEYAAAKVRVYGTNGLRREIVATAEGFIGTQYQWGGRSLEEGFDCSGLAMAIYQLNGLNLPRTSLEQFLAGTPVSRADIAQGDLVFFAIKGGGKVSHVGLYAGEGRFIHAPRSGKLIRSDLLAQMYYSKRYVGGRTYL